MKNDKFEEYFLKYKTLVIRIVMSKTCDYYTAQEICQQVFISFYKNMDRISPELAKAWLIRATQNAVIDYYRKKGGRYEVALDGAVSEEGNLLIEKSVELFEEKHDKKELVGRILREVRAVNKQWYEVLMLCCIEDMPYAEVAERLGISVSVLRARVYRARLFIKERFRDEYLNG